MGRLPSLISASLLVAPSLIACDRTEGGATGAPSTRSQSISASAPPSIAATTAVSADGHAPAVPPRKLCESELGQPGKKLPKGTFTGIAASGAERPGNNLVTNSGRWTWINFFAAWCGPCKEEMPRLKSFQQKLSKNLDVVFVSLDDDERQLKQFLERQEQNASGVRSALWFQPGKARGTWLSNLNMKESPDLPAHVLVDGTGKVRCVVGGAIEDTDFPAVAAIVAR